MKLFGAIKFWMPLAGLGAALALAPQSRAQADVSPDHFDENGISSDFGHATASAPKAAATPASPAAAQDQKANGNAKGQTVSTKKSPAASREQLVAVDDKSKVPPRKKNDQQ
jgi:hypothetical protein